MINHCLSSTIPSSEAALRGGSAGADMADQTSVALHYFEDPIVSLAPIELAGAGCDAPAPHGLDAGQAEAAAGRVAVRAASAAVQVARRAALGLRPH